MKEEKVYLTLQNGRVFEGKRFGAKGDVLGELVFTTGMTGYIETLTDPSYFGQIVIQTFPLIGNYGMILSDRESKKPYLSGYIVREYCEAPSNFRCEEKIDDYLKEQNVVGVYGIDTRELTKTVREAGVMNAVISSRPVADVAAIGQYVIRDAVRHATCETVKYYGDEQAKRKIVLWDFGAKENIVRELVRRGNRVIRVPSWYTAEQILAFGPDGLMLTNGPGDPAENTDVIANIRALAGKLPIFGICLGHQLFALAMGGKTKKMKYGHRGGNQPAMEVDTGRIYVTSQNHGYAVDGSTIPADKGYVSFINVNDGTCEGVNYTKANAFSVQFHPEACAGPLDTRFLFDRFISRMEEK